MRKLVTILLILLLSNIGFSQTSWNKKGIQKMLSNYFELFSELELDKSLDYTYPKMYDIIPKEFLLSQLEKTFDDPTMEVSMNNFKVQNIGEIINYDDILYSKVAYSFAMTMKATAEEGEDQQELNDFLLDIYQITYGNENVLFDETLGIFEIQFNNELFAIGDKTIGDWKMIGNKKGAEQFMKMLIPIEVLEELNGKK